VDIDADMHDINQTIANDDLSYSVPLFGLESWKGGAWNYNSGVSDTTITDPYGNYHFGAVCSAAG
jgi:hypothetical protein